MPGKHDLTFQPPIRRPALLLWISALCSLPCLVSTSRGSELLSTVPAREGLLLPPNSTADGGGCLILRDRIPTGLPLGHAGQHPSVGGCCSACRQERKCTVFAYCPLEAGCTVDSAYGSATSLPFRGCLLLSQGLSAPETGRPVVAIPASGFQGGAPIVAAPDPIEGYEVLVGQDFLNGFDYICPGSLSAGKCMLRGTPHALARRCDLDPHCRAMVHLPAGWDYLGTNIVVLKGGAGVSLAAADATLNQHAVSFMKLEPAAQEGGSGMSGGTVAGIVVSACTTTAAVVAGAAALCWRRQRRLDRAPAGAAAAAPAASELAPGKESPEASDAGALRKGSFHDSAFDEEQRMRTGAWVAEAQQQSSDSKAAAARPGSSGSSSTAPEDTPRCPMPWLQVPAALTALPEAKVPKRMSLEQAMQHRTSLAGINASNAAKLGLPPCRTPTPGKSGSTASGSGASEGAGTSSRPSHISSSGVSCASEHGEPGGSGSGDSGRKLDGGRSWEDNMDSMLDRSHDSGGMEDATGSSGQTAANATTLMLCRMPEAPWQDWVVHIDDIEFCKNADGSYQELGTGGFGTVYRVMLDGVQVHAAKVIELGQSAEVQTAFLREVSLLRRLRHRNVTNFRGVCISEGRGILLMEMMEGGDLQSKIAVVNKLNNERLFSWHNRGKRVALDVARGIHYLHSLSLTHFDVKANNVLLTRDLTAKLSDVGFTRLMSNTHHSFKDGRTGTFAYMAPELLIGRPCTESVDIFSFGVMLWEICTGERPMRGQNRPLSTQDCPQEVVDLYDACTSEDPAARPSAKVLVQQLTKLNALPAPTSR